MKDKTDEEILAQFLKDYGVLLHKNPSSKKRKYFKKLLKKKQKRRKQK